MVSIAARRDEANLRRILGCTGHPGLKPIIDNRFTGGLHLAVMTGSFLDMIITGRKTVESRFHRQRRAPLFTAKPGDVVVFRQSSYPATVAAILGDTDYLDITEIGIGRIRSEWAARIGCDDDEFWASRADARWVSLLSLESIFPIPPQPLHKRDRSAWVSYSAEEPRLFQEEV